VDRVEADLPMFTSDLVDLLVERRRAVVVGERTAGAANPGRPYSVSARLEMVAPVTA